MKKAVLLVLILATASFIFAQEAPKKPAQGDWGLGFRIQGLSNFLIGEFDEDALGTPQLLARRYLTNRIVVRTAFGINARNGDTRFENSFLSSQDGTPVRIDTLYRETSSQLNISFSPGAEYHFTSSAARLDPYVGFVIPIGLAGSTTTEVDDELKITNQENGDILYNKDIAASTELDGGLSFGFSILAGFNYFVSNNIAIGAEYNLGLLINNLGGNYRSREAGSIQQSADPTDILSVDNDFAGRREESTTNVTLSSVGVNLSIFW